MQLKLVDKLSNLIILNLFYILGMISIVGSGSSDAALNAVLIRTVRNEEGYVYRDFIKFFKMDFLKNLQAFLAVIFFPLLLVVIFVSSIYTPLPFYVIDVVRNICFVVLVLFVLATTFVAPLNARYKNTLRNSFHNSIFLAYKHFFLAVLIRIIQCIPFLLFFFLQGQLFVWLTLMIFILPALSGYACAYIYSYIFSKYDKLN